MKISAAAANLACDALVNALEGGTIKVYSGSQPATVATAATGTLLATMTIDASAFPPASGGSSTATNITADSSGDANGTPGYCRFATSGGTDLVDMSAGVGSGEVNFNANVSLGGAVDITSLTIAIPLA